MGPYPYKGNQSFDFGSGLAIWEKMITTMVIVKMTLMTMTGIFRVSQVGVSQSNLIILDLILSGRHSDIATLGQQREGKERCF